MDKLHMIAARKADECIDVTYTQDNSRSLLLKVESHACEVRKRIKGEFRELPPGGGQHV